MCYRSSGTPGGTARLRLRAPRFVIFEIVLGTLDVLVLSPFVSSAQKENNHLAEASEVNAVARPPIKPQLHYTFPYRLTVAEAPGRDTCEPRFNFPRRLHIAQALKPVAKGLLAESRLVKMQRHDYCIL